MKQRCVIMRSRVGEDCGKKIVLSGRVRRNTASVRADNSFTLNTLYQDCSQCSLPHQKQNSHYFRIK